MVFDRTKSNGKSTGRIPLKLSTRHDRHKHDVSNRKFHFDICSIRKTKIGKHEVFGRLKLKHWAVALDIHTGTVVIEELIPAA